MQRLHNHNLFKAFLGRTNGLSRFYRPIAPFRTAIIARRLSIKSTQVESTELHDDEHSDETPTAHYIFGFIPLAIIAAGVVYAANRILFGVNGNMNSLTSQISTNWKKKWSSEEESISQDKKSTTTSETAPGAPKLPRVFMDVSIGGKPAGKLIFELRSDLAPKTSENFRILCTCERGNDLCYKGNPFHRVIPGFMAQGGDITSKDGRGGKSIFGKKFEDEILSIKHHQAGILSMANAGPNTNSSQFFITFRALPHLDGRHVVFGHLVKGFETLDKIEQAGSRSGMTHSAVVITDCGQE